MGVHHHGEFSLQEAIILAASFLVIVLPAAIAAWRRR